MSPGGVARVLRMELAKLRAQPKASLVLGACLLAPWAFVLVLQRQSGLPEDTLFGRAVKQSGFATPLFVLGFAAQWALPVLSSVVGGDVVSAEDRHGTWKTVLTRSRTRGEVFLGKAAAAMLFAAFAAALLGASSLAAGVVGIGRQPLLGLTGNELAPGRAAALVAFAWASVLPPVLGFTALALAISAATRSSAAGIGLPVLVGLVMELFSFAGGSEGVRRLLLSSAFGGWHGLFADPPFRGTLLHGVLVSAAYVAFGLGVAWGILRRRDIGG